MNPVVEAALEGPGTRRLGIQDMTCDGGHLGQGAEARWDGSLTELPQGWVWNGDKGQGAQALGQRVLS